MLDRRRTVAVGDAPEPRTFGPVTQTDIVRFAGAGGDFNPLHHDHQRAMAAGFPAPIAMGQFTAGLLAAWVTDTFGVENLRTYEVRFTAPLTIGATVQLSGKVLEVGNDCGEVVAHLELTATVEDTTVLAGDAVVAVSAGGRAGGQGADHVG